MSELDRERFGVSESGATRVKVCGLTNLADAQVAVEAGADLLGFIFYPRSPRYVAPETVRTITAALGGRGWSPAPRFVGVFVNTPADQVAETLDFCGLHLAQLHGDEGPEFWQILAGRAFKALRPQGAADGEAALARFGALGPVDGPDLLLDAYHPRLRGGTGQVADWSLAADLAPQRRLLLAGGLTPENVAVAARRVRPWGVDVGSGVEAEPGRKDPARVRHFVAAAKRQRADG